ncbi:MAG: PEGA domain-containing protein, partial [Myxococcales bacterium]|nr:PEGA domain-containing protein [Myxococcales bacterium]
MSRAVQWAVLAGAFGLAAAPPGRVQADGARLVLPSVVVVEGEVDPAPRVAAGHIAHRLAEGGARLMPAKRARTLFEQRGSTSPLTVSHTDLDALARDTQMALYHVASGLPGRARQDVERAITRADKVLESLNRESLAAQQLLDACLYLVRAHLQKRERKRAAEQALECRRLVPDIEPDGTMHPPDVIGILAEAEAALRHRRPGSLRVESVPSGCAVFVNGRQLGTAPLELPHLSPGEYRLQAECEQGRAGRVHRVTIGSTRVVKRIDTRFDGAVQTSLDIGLRYVSAEQQRTLAHQHAVEVGRVVGAEEVWLTLQVHGPGAGGRVVQVHRIRVRDGALIAAVRMRMGESEAFATATLDAAMRDLHEGVKRDHSVEGSAELGDVSRVAAVTRSQAPALVEAAQAVPETPEEEAARSGVEAIDDLEGEPDDDGWSPPVASLVVGGTGAATMLVSWGLYGRHLDLELTYSDQKSSGADYSQTLDDLESFELIPVAVSATGGVLMASSLPWLLPPEDELPTWTLVVGGTGLAAGVAGGA